MPLFKSLCYINNKLQLDFQTAYSDVDVCSIIWAHRKMKAGKCCGLCQQLVFIIRCIEAEVLEDQERSVPGKRQIVSTELDLRETTNTVHFVDSETESWQRIFPYNGANEAFLSVQGDRAPSRA